MLTFTALGIPRPQPRPRAFRGVIVATADPKAREWSDKVANAALRAGQAPKGAISVTMDFRFPTRRKDRHLKPHTNTPDADNLAKLALDAIQRSKTITNDSLVAELIVRKAWDCQSAPGACFTIKAYHADAQAMPQAPAWISPPQPSTGTQYPPDGNP